MVFTRNALAWDDQLQMKTLGAEILYEAAPRFPKQVLFRDGCWQACATLRDGGPGLWVEN